MTRSLVPLILCLLAMPAIAQQTGRCTQGSAWWWQGKLAGYGPCDRPQEGFLLLSCRDGAVVMDVDIALAAGTREGAVSEVTLKVDDRSFPLTGEATRFPSTGNLGLGLAVIGPESLEALASGNLATLVTPNAGHEFHLTGSRDATNALLQACGG